MATAILSDLHLGTSFGEDLLRDAEVRSRLLEKISGAERLVLLGDTIELREDPLPAVLERARPFLEEVGATFAGREVILVPGNHDHRLAEPLLEGLALGGEAAGLENRATPGPGPGAQLAAMLGAARTEVAYPGVWLRDDVYATHGHYMDVHMSLPRLECLAAATSLRLYGPLPAAPAPADYERALSAIYALTYSLAQSPARRRATRPSEGAWRFISGRRNGRRRVRGALLDATLAAAVPATVWTLNRLLRTEFRHDLSATAISRSGIEAASELAGRLGVDAAHVITGHTHRAGPDPEEPGWRLAGGGELHNTGSWVFASVFHPPQAPPGPYWPGTITWLDAEGPTLRERLLAATPREDLVAAVRRNIAAGA